MTIEEMMNKNGFVTVVKEGNEIVTAYEPCIKISDAIRIAKEYAEEIEIWANIPEYDYRYQVSTIGNVKSITSKTIYSDGRYRTHEGVLLSQGTDNKGYKVVSLSKNGNHTSYRVHRLVAIVFLPNPEHHNLVMHIDSNKANNTIYNLKWGTQSENIKQSFDEGRTPVFGGDHPLATREAEVYEIAYKLFSENIGSTLVSRQLNIPLRTVQEWKKNWKRYIAPLERKENNNENI